MSSSSRGADVVVVGAGILGLFTALHLAELGSGVIVVEGQCVGAGASGHSGALIRSNCETEVESRLAQRSLAVFRNWSEAVGGDAGFAGVGILELAGSHDGSALRARVDRQKGFGIEIGLIEPAEIRGLSPAINLDDVSVAAFQRDAGYCEPILVLQSLFAAARRKGIQFAFGNDVQALSLDGQRCRGVIVDGTQIGADAVVVAAGEGAASLLRTVAPGLKLTPYRSTLATFHPGWDGGTYRGPALLDRVQDAWFRPVRDGGVMVGMGLGGNAGADRSPEAGAIRADYAAAAHRRFGLPPRSACRAIWQGTYVLSADGLPIVGKHATIAGLYMAVGDCGGAFKSAPAIGEDLAQLIVHGASRAVGIEQLSPARLT